jgi:hypothetical protein
MCGMAAPAAVLLGLLFSPNDSVQPRLISFPKLNGHSYRNKYVRLPLYRYNYTKAKVHLCTYISFFLFTDEKRHDFLCRSLTQTFERKIFICLTLEVLDNMGIPYCRKNRTIG